MEKLLNKIQEQLDNGYYVEAEDIQRLVDECELHNSKPIREALLKSGLLFPRNKEELDVFEKYNKSMQNP